MVYHFGAAPLEWGGHVKHGRDEEIAFGVDVTPFADANRGEAVGELVGVFEAGVDHGAALEVDVSIAMVFFDEGETIVEAVGFGTVAAIVVFHWQDDMARGVDDAPFVVNGDAGALLVEEACHVVFAGDDFTA